MDIRDKTREELIAELQELKSAFESLKAASETALLNSRHLEEELVRSRIMLNTIENAARIGGWEFDAETGEQTWTEEVFNILEYDLSNGTPDVPQGVGFIAPEYQPMALLGIRRAIENGEPYDQEWEIITAKGNRRWVNAIGRPYIENGKTRLVAGSFQDITQRKMAEVALAESEERYRSLFNSLEAGIVVHGADTSVILNNPRASVMLGLTDEQLRGKVAIDPAWNFIDEGFRVLAQEDYPVNRILKSKKSLQNQIIGIRRPTTQDLVWVSVNGIPILNSKDEITEIVISFIDITERKEAELALKASETRFKNMFERHSAIMLLIEPGTGQIIDANEAATKFYGYSKQALGSMRIDEINMLSPDQVGTERVKALQEKQSYFVFPHKLANGDMRTVEVHSSPIDFHDEQILFSIIHDITGRRQAEEKLRESELKYRSLIESSSDAIFCVDEKGEYKFTNQLFASTLGQSPDFFIGKTFWDIYDKEHADYRYAATKRVFETGVGESIEVDVPLPDRTLYFLAKTNPIKDESGKVILNLTHASDITALKMVERELQQAKERAEESDRLKSAFLANMSHEIRTPMNGILGFAQLLKEPGLNGDQQQKYLGIIEKSGDRMLSIINDIIDISKIEAGLMTLDIRESDPNEQLDYINTFFKPEIETKGIELAVHKDLPGKEAVILTDREKLYAILTNLVKNAIKFTTGGTIEAGYRKKEAYLEFYVKDTGAGIPADKQESIFERFFQADTPGNKAPEGAGLGLSISRAYVEMLGGTMWLESKEGAGSAFYFTLPYHKGKQQDADLADDADDTRGNQDLPRERGLKILIAEDDEVSAMLLSISLKQAGREFITVNTGLEAVSTCRSNPDIDLVLMDIRLPRMAGYEATRQIRQFNKEVVIIAQTAYGLKGDREKAIEAGCNDYIVKPIERSSLLSLIEKYFGSRDTRD